MDYAHLAVKNAGYIPYYMYRQKNTVDNLENVGFCLPGCEGKYNIYMMEEIHSIFAIGAGAVSKLVDRKSGKIDRIFEYKYPYEYLSDENEQREKDKKEKRAKRTKNAKKAIANPTPRLRLPQSTRNDDLRRLSFR